mmetsp:Transcript_31141/g.29701  ORF Transcript_31141/g.29701 Transcript_31141/m.29701 type:complete len:517 (+) Transcript_31141:382-1932(+)|eukprot:CAMPEP_0119046040 /NCGR_PEP_ID=MMETSP1177-20130426/44033_1 /TAXON_ID=2985 /ORGANISM="Ochromonas sp, Strain CCMP1899" /LENGTH=516 /DNA_ID=CAMNT_0007018643 /DNA_START=367 /DNA_END=1917 /DNA_ORIENTATION=-
MTDNFPHEITWEKFRTQNCSGGKPYSLIGSVLVDKCFTNEVSVIEEILHQSLPLLDAELKRVKPEQRKLKIAMDVGKSIGLNNLGFLNREEEQRLLFETALIVLLYFDEDLFRCPYSDVESLLSQYPEFEHCDERELKKLLNFTNFMNCAIILLPAKGKKSHLLDLVTRITEGHKIKYITGGGQTSSTALRVLIYEREGGVAKSQRALRRTEWISLPKVLRDDTENLILHGMQRIIPTLGTNDGDQPSLPSKSLSSLSSMTLMASMSSPRSKRMCHRSLEALEHASCVTLSCAVGNEHGTDMDCSTINDDLFNEDLRFFEKPSGSNGLIYTSSMSSENGQRYRNISIARKVPSFNSFHGHSNDMFEHSNKSNSQNSQSNSRSNSQPNSLSNSLDLLASTALDMEVEHSDIKNYKSVNNSSPFKVDNSYKVDNDRKNYGNSNLNLDLSGLSQEKGSRKEDGSKKEEDLPNDPPTWPNTSPRFYYKDLAHLSDMMHTISLESNSRENSPFNPVCRLIP